jgi:Leucine-rich repeat (LRR) protein
MNIQNLNLFHKNLNEIPKEIFDLTQLTNLYLYNNNLTQIPIEIKQLCNLSTLNLSQNNLSNLPIEIGQLCNLSTLNLSQNNLGNLPVELFNLTQLTKLNLFHNNLVNIPSEIGNLTQLNLLYLDKNQLTDIPKEIGKLCNLSILNLAHNNLLKLPIEIGDMKNLVILNLSYNNLYNIPKEISNLIQLTTLYLSHNNIIKLPIEIGYLTQLTLLHLNNNPIENTLNPIIQRLIKRIENKTNLNSIYNDKQNTHSSTIQQSVKNSIILLMNFYQDNYPVFYLDWPELHQKTKEIITEYINIDDTHTILNITFKELFIAVNIELEKLSLIVQKEIKQRLNEEMQDSECKCFTGRISRLVNSLSGFSNKVNIQISENEEISNIISNIMQRREFKSITLLKEQIMISLLERGYDEDKIYLWLDYIE